MDSLRMIIGVFLQVLTLLLFFGMQNPPIESKTVLNYDRVVVVFNESIITKSDVLLERQLAPVLKIQSEILQYNRIHDPLEAIIQMEILRFQAGDISLYQPSNKETQLRYNEFRSQWTSIEEYQTFLVKVGVQEERIIGMIYNHLLIERYLERNLGIEGSDSSLATQDQFHQWYLETKERVSIRYIEEL